MKEPIKPIKEKIVWNHIITIGHYKNSVQPDFSVSEDDKEAYSLAELVKRAEGKENVYLVHSNFGYYGPENYSLQERQVIPNENYEAEMVQYEKDLKEYNDFVAKKEKLKESLSSKKKKLVKKIEQLQSELKNLK